MLELREFFTQYIVAKKLIVGLLIAAVVVTPVVWAYGIASLQSIPYRIARGVLRWETDYSTRNFDQIEGKHFIVRYEAPDASVAPMVLDLAEEVYTPMAKSWGYKNDGKLLIIIYPGEKQMLQSLHWSIEKSPMGAYQGGVVKVLSPYLWAEDGQNINYELRHSGPIVHELMHLMVDYETNGNHARWFTEGLAQYMEVQMGGTLWFEPQHFTVKDAYSIEKLENSFDDPDHLALTYWEAYSLTIYLVDTYGQDAIHRICSELKRGTSMEGAVKKVTGQDYKSLEHSWRQWAEKQEA